jgi:hypothetical protein
VSVFELRLFRAVVGVVLLIPLVVGSAGAFGGIGGLAALFHVEPPISVSPSLANSLRAICWMFFALVPMVIWTLLEMKERAGGFRVIVVCASTAGFVRLLGCWVDGYPGVVPVIFMLMELLLLPAVLLWHTRLVRGGELSRIETIVTNAGRANRLAARSRACLRGQWSMYHTNTAPMAIPRVRRSDIDDARCRDVVARG